MICALCHGMGYRFTLQCGRQWWPCPACATTGSRVLHGPGTISISKAQGKYLRQLPNAPTEAHDIAGAANV